MTVDTSEHKFDKVVPALNDRNKLIVPYKDDDQFGKCLY